MANPDEERITINVKGVSAEVWEKARKAAAQRGDAMGAWLSRAIATQANLEAGPRELAPDPPAPEAAHPPLLTPAEFKTLAEGVEVARRISGEKLPAALGAQLDLLAADIVRAARGLKLRARGSPRRLAAPAANLRLIG